MQLMSVGDKLRLWIPADLAYGETPSGIVFDIELISIAK